MRKPLSRIQGFTLLELLVVVTLMAIVATVALVANDGVQDEAAVDATKYEMAELRKALLQFRRDTGAFPKTGINTCRDPAEPANQNKSNPDMVFPAQLTTEPAQVSWCEAQESLWHLMKCPFDPNSDTCTWNPDTKRGWHGPYISGQWGYVDIDDASSVDERLIPAIADQFTSDLYEWHACADSHGAIPPDDPTCEGYRSKGQPYLLLVHDDPSTATFDESEFPRIVSAGPDGRYGGANETEDTICLPKQSNETGKDDLVLCLLK